MSITPEIQDLINRLQQELNELEQKTAISSEEIQTAGERLSLMLGVVLETKMRVENLVNRLGD